MKWKENEISESSGEAERWRSLLSLLLVLMLCLGGATSSVCSHAAPHVGELSRSLVADPTIVAQRGGDALSLSAENE